MTDTYQKPPFLPPDQGDKIDIKNNISFFEIFNCGTTASKMVEIGPLEHINIKLDL